MCVPVGAVRTVQRCGGVGWGGVVAIGAGVPLAVLAALDGVTLPKALIDSARETVLYEKDSTRFGVVQAITAVARQKTTDPDLRFAMERAAGEYLAAA